MCISRLLHILSKRTPCAVGRAPQHPARLDLLPRRRCQHCSPATHLLHFRCHYCCQLSRQLVRCATLAAPAINHANMTSTNGIAANPSTTKSFRALVYNSTAHTDHIACLCSDCRCRSSCIIQIPTFASLFSSIQPLFHYTVSG